METEAYVTAKNSHQIVLPSIAPHRRTLGTHCTTGHFGEILQGVFFDKAGGLHRGLITLCCPALSTTASFVPDDEEAIVYPFGKTKAAAAARRTLSFLGHGNCGGTLTINSNIQVGFGMGSSTSDVASTINAVAQAFGRTLSPSAVAKLAVESEVASDSTMFNNAVVLFAQREGKVLEHLGSCLPPLLVLCINTAPFKGVDTLAFPPARYSPWEIEAFKSLLSLARRAISTGDAALIGRVASASARINQRFLPKPAFTKIEKIAAEAGAVGIQVAHSGTVVGLLFDARNRLATEMARQASDALNKIEMPPFMTFLTDEVDHHHAC